MRSNAAFIAWKADKPVFTVVTLVPNPNSIPSLATFGSIATFYDKCDQGYICLEGSKSKAPTDP